MLLILLSFATKSQTELAKLVHQEKANILVVTRNHHLYYGVTYVNQGSTILFGIFFR